MFIHEKPYIEETMFTESIEGTHFLWETRKK